MNFQAILIHACHIQCFAVIAACLYHDRSFDFETMLPQTVPKNRRKESDNHEVVSLGSGLCFGLPGK